MWPVIVGWLMTLAEQSAVVADPISGGAGWVGAGLLGLVLGWLLLVHLPAKDKQLENKDKQHTTSMELKDVQLKAFILEKDTALKEQLEAKDKQFNSLLEAKDKQIADHVQQGRAMLLEVVREYKEALKISTTHCETQTIRAESRQEKDIHLLTEAIGDVSVKMDTLIEHRRSQKTADTIQAKGAN